MMWLFPTVSLLQPIFIRSLSVLCRPKEDYVYASQSSNSARTKYSLGDVPSGSDLSATLFYFLVKCPHLVVAMSWRIISHLLGFFFQAVVNIKEVRVCVCVSCVCMCTFVDWELFNDLNVHTRTCHQSYSLYILTGQKNLKQLLVISNSNTCISFSVLRPLIALDLT